MGKGHGRIRKQLCVEDAENDSIHVDLQGGKEMEEQ